ncbi:protein of unknown function [Thermomonospora echinospora]|uniref:Cyclic nucleotide-binding domain-containing protein n=1 Tax=Thermomonospora echinospora TaxID=1992 RepID=A0A1H6DJ97_9ACTN|nr:DUF1707 domain-containing protein [Thermomonospora echinospora]SEG84775.1 protein of unknown function [Thermomonospora echinospora]
MRAGDADRDATIQALGDALAEGRLDPAEHDSRLTRAATATTFGQLAALTADLPPSPSAATGGQTTTDPAHRQDDRRAWLKEVQYWLGGALVMNLIWAAQSLKDHQWASYWPAVPLGIWAAILLTYLIWPQDRD